MDGIRQNLVRCGLYGMGHTIHILDVPRHRSFPINLGFDLSETAEGLCVALSNGTSKIQSNWSDGARGSGVNNDRQFAGECRCEDCWC